MHADHTAYAIHPIPIHDIKAIRKATPTLGWHHVVLVLANGVSLAPLYFHTGGVKSLISALKQVGMRLGAAHTPAGSERVNE